MAHRHSWNESILATGQKADPVNAITLAQTSATDELVKVVESLQETLLSLPKTQTPYCHYPLRLRKSCAVALFLEDQEGIARERKRKLVE